MANSIFDPPLTTNSLTNQGPHWLHVLGLYDGWTPKFWTFNRVPPIRVFWCNREAKSTKKEENRFIEDVERSMQPITFGLSL